jgi:membrane associated rhomboid family serine protease
MYGPPDELRCRACVQRRFPTTNVPTAHRSTVFRRWPPVTLFVIIAAVIATLVYLSKVRAVEGLFAIRLFVWEWQLWRLLTAVFLHDISTPLHIAFNALWMWRLGKPVENWMGSWRYAGFFVAAGAGSSAAQFLTGDPGIGLSGVVYALVGLLIVLRREEQFAAELMPPSLIQFFVVWFFICIVLTRFGWLPVANAAHGAGAVIGWLYGRAALTQRPVLGVVAVSVLCVALVLSTHWMPWDGHYDYYRGLVCARQEDYAGAEEWYRLAAKRLSGDAKEEAEAWARWAEQMRDKSKENGE